MDFTKEKLIPPVREGDIVKVKVSGLGKNGDPIMKYNKFVLFLKGAERKFSVGDPIKVRVVRIMDNFGYAELV